MRPERDRSAALGEAATVVVIVFAFQLAGELADALLTWVGQPAPGVIEPLTIATATAFASALSWAGIIVAAAYIYLRVRRYHDRTPDPETSTGTERQPTDRTKNA